MAPVLAATGDPATALDILRRALREADRIGDFAAGLEARLALGLLQRQTGDPAAGATLQEVRRIAEPRRVPEGGAAGGGGTDGADDHPDEPQG